MFYTIYYTDNCWSTISTAESLVSNVFAHFTANLKRLTAPSRKVKKMMIILYLSLYGVNRVYCTTIYAFQNCKPSENRNNIIFSGEVHLLSLTLWGRKCDANAFGMGPRMWLCLDLRNVSERICLIRTVRNSSKLSLALKILILAY